MNCALAGGELCRIAELINAVILSDRERVRLLSGPMHNEGLFWLAAVKLCKGVATFGNLVSLPDGSGVVFSDDCDYCDLEIPLYLSNGKRSDVHIYLHLMNRDSNNQMYITDIRMP